ncbi:hypothetical protein B0H11DRAFT_2103130 [Mycena galericulata]|nr:hypothetical protein B0H11DRAFT_2103130 [Mycena galericulata]
MYLRVRGWEVEVDGAVRAVRSMVRAAGECGRYMGVGLAVCRDRASRASRTVRERCAVRLSMWAACACACFEAQGQGTRPSACSADGPGDGDARIYAYHTGRDGRGARAGSVYVIRECAQMPASLATVMSVDRRGTHGAEMHLRLSSGTRWTGINEGGSRALLMRSAARHLDVFIFWIRCISRRHCAALREALVHALCRWIPVFRLPLVVDRSLPRPLLHFEFSVCRGWSTLSNLVVRLFISVICWRREAHTHCRLLYLCTP